MRLAVKRALASSLKANEMSRYSDIALTASAPAVWGTTYVVTSQMLPEGYPLTLALLRALPAGLLLLLVVRVLPPRKMIWRIVLLGTFNFAAFWALLFVAAYRLPGGVAATLGSIQALLVVLLASRVLDIPVTARALFAAVAGVAGVALLILTPEAELDAIGILAGFGGALSMAAGTVFSRKWRGTTPLLTFTAWQLTAGGLVLLPLALWFEPSLPPLTMTHIAGMAWLGVIGAALSYALWFRGVQRLQPSAVSTLGFLSPLVAVLIGWLYLGEALSAIQAIGALIILSSVAVAHRPSNQGRLAA